MKWYIVIFGALISDERYSKANYLFYGISYSSEWPTPLWLLRRLKQKDQEFEANLGNLSIP